MNSLVIPVSINIRILRIQFNHKNHNRFNNMESFQMAKALSGFLQRTLENY